MSETETTAVVFDHVWKRYRPRLGLATLMGLLRLAEREAADWALRDVSFEVARGECLGIMGPDGAGKTTLIRILARLSPVTWGRYEVRGTVSCLIDLGAGLQAELTGRENIHLNGAILGMGRREVRKKTDDIADFAEVQGFLDVPVKRYSAATCARLGFAIVTSAESDVLLVDDVLPAADAEFGAKCLARLNDIRAQGRTIVFVSRNVDHIGALCDRTLYLRSGEVHTLGPTEETLRAYEEDMRGALPAEVEEPGPEPEDSTDIESETEQPVGPADEESAPAEDSDSGPPEPSEDQAEP